MPPAPNLLLTISRPGKGEKSYRIEPGIYTMGSEKENMIVLPGDDISWRHAILSYFEDGTWLEDLNSKQGTFLDGERVTGRLPVTSGQVIALGPYRIEVSPAEAVPAPPPEPAPAPRVETPPPPAAPPPAEGPGTPAPGEVLDPMQAIKAQVQEELHERLDIKRLAASHIGEDDLHDRVRTTLEKIVSEVRSRLPHDIEPEALIKEIYDEAVGLGPLEDLLASSEITEIMVNGPNRIYTEEGGRLILTGKRFLNNDSVLAIIERIVSPIGRRIDESQPYVDARLPDGSRVNAIISPLSLSGPCLTIRKFSKEPFKVSDLINFGTMSAGIAQFIDVCVKLRKNIVVSGGTGSGKTTLLNVLSNYLPETERIVTIEDAAELRLIQDHVIRLESRPPNIEGRGAVTIRDLVRNALRMRPDRIVVGEVRGGEALDMLQAMNTGHEGSLTTVHANSPRDVISRLETMVLMSGMEIPVRAIREQIGAAIHMVVHTSRYSDGSRKVSRISEVVGLEGEQITMQDIFEFKQTGVDEKGKVLGHYEPTGSVPTFLEDIHTRGLKIDHHLFDPGYVIDH